MDSAFMRRCLQLASLGRGHVSPNPMVGAVVVHEGRIIGEGYHRCCGQPHAEVNAIASVADESLLSRSTLYVSLEPCSHYGKTPPCAELIVAKQIPRVVVGCLDPFPAVSGRGIARLREAGIEVITGVLDEECRELNRTFMTFQTRRRPFVTLKWAQSHDGYIDLLPALPDDWTYGYFERWRVRGGAEVSLKWRNGKAWSAEIRSEKGGQFKLKMPRGVKRATVRFSDSHVLSQVTDMLVLDFKPGMSCRILFE